MAEQQEAARILGASIRWGGFDDGAIPDGATAIEVIDAAIAATGADVMYTHTPRDTHQDHRSVATASLAAARRMQVVLYYETPSTQLFEPTVYVDISDMLDEKMRALLAHESQIVRSGPVEVEAIEAEAAVPRLARAGSVRGSVRDAPVRLGPAHDPARPLGYSFARDGSPRGRGIMSRGPRPAPWTLLAFGGVVIVLVALFGAGSASAIVATIIAVIFLVFLMRHMAFAASALETAPFDMATLSGFDFGYRPFVTVMVPCRNEEMVIDGLLDCLLALEYPHELLEIIVINDGSDDTTGEIIDRRAADEPRLRCLHRPHGSPGGKSGALNTALEIARGDVIVVFDADHKCRSDVLKRLVRHFSDPRVGAVQGRCIVRNSEESSLSKTIAIDYYCGYLVNEYGRQSLYRLPAYGGANCAVRTTSLRALGGWNEDSVTEDTDLTLRLVLNGERVRYDVTAIDTEEGVPTFRRFWRQRYRWARGHQEAWLEYRKAVWRSPLLSNVEKFETTMFLLVYHVPLLCSLGILLVLLRVVGLVHWAGTIDLTPIAILLFLGPLLELASGLIVSKAPRKSAFGMLLFLPSYLVFIVVCSKAWIDGVLGRPYAWHKTERSGEPDPPAAAATARQLAAAKP